MTYGFHLPVSISGGRLLSGLNWEAEDNAEPYFDRQYKNIFRFETLQTIVENSPDIRSENYILHINKFETKIGRKTKTKN